MRVDKVKTKKGKRILDDRAPKTVENDKTALFIKGSKTNQTVTDAMMDIYVLKKPLVQQLKRHNPFHLFDDETPIEKFGEKYDASLFLFGSSSKKRPSSLVFGRTHDGQILDMVELSIVKFTPARDFETPKVMLGTKPCIVLEGPEFESDSTMKRIGNLLVDFFKGPTLDMVRLQGLEELISFTAKENMIYMRVYSTTSIQATVYILRVILLKSATNVPRIELLEMGPSIDFKVDRTKLASDSLFKAACKKPKALMVRSLLLHQNWRDFLRRLEFSPPYMCLSETFLLKMCILQAKRRKNMSEDVFGNQLARVHVGKQNTDAIQTRYL
ncbi:brix domain protein [Ancylostoma ceylanicum]|uniref:Ribosome production factor 2 homolog n=1 Tax=Ancylostoma ceylanicum TaxID=53326 RepID=A0A0D6L8S6_9BILA|nr:brix domain protein [Ancylostoma ceylanicum]